MCSKVPYLSRDDANRAKGKVGKGSRVYQCPECGQWHLTTLPPNVYRQRRKKQKRSIKLHNELVTELRRANCAEG